MLQTQPSNPSQQILPYTTEANGEGEEHCDVNLLSDEEIEKLMKDEQDVSTQIPLAEKREEYWDVNLLSDEERETVLWIKQLMKDEQKVSIQTPLVENREDQENVQPSPSQEPSREVSYPHLLQNSRPMSNIVEDDTEISLDKYEIEDYELRDCSLNHYMVGHT